MDVCSPFHPTASISFCNRACACSNRAPRSFCHAISCSSCVLCRASTAAIACGAGPPGIARSATKCRTSSDSRTTSSDKPSARPKTCCAAASRCAARIVARREFFAQAHSRTSCATTRCAVRNGKCACRTECVGKFSRGRKTFCRRAGRGEMRDIPRCAGEQHRVEQCPVRRQSASIQHRNSGR